MAEAKLKPKPVLKINDGKETKPSDRGVASLTSDRVASVPNVSKKMELKPKSTKPPVLTKKRKQIEIPKITPTVKKMDVDDEEQQATKPKKEEGEFVPEEQEESKEQEVEEPKTKKTKVSPTESTSKPLQVGSAGPVAKSRVENSPQKTPAKGASKISEEKQPVKKNNTSFKIDYDEQCKYMDPFHRGKKDHQNTDYSQYLSDDGEEGEGEESPENQGEDSESPSSKSKFRTKKNGSPTFVEDSSNESSNESLNKSKSEKKTPYSSDSKLSSITCYRCQQKGHYATQCTEKKSASSPFKGFSSGGGGGSKTGGGSGAHLSKCRFPFKIV